MIFDTTHIISKPLLYALFFLFLATSMFGIFHHELWLDEAHHWLLARDSNSLIDLITKTRNEGHPVLWNIFLYGISRFSTNPIWMQVFHTLITSYAVFIFLKKAPFNIMLKVLFIFGYYMLFEYTLLSRNYSIGILFLFLACSIYEYRHQKSVLYFSLLALACNTHAMIAMIGISLALIWVIEVIKIRPFSINKKQGVGLVIFSIAILLTILQVIPSSENLVLENAQKAPILDRFSKSVIAFFKGVIQVPDFRSINFWNSNLIINWNKPITAILSVISLSIPFVLLYKNKLILFFGYTSIFFLMGVIFFTQVSTARHQGVFVIILCIALWIEHYHRKSFLNVRHFIPLWFLKKSRITLIIVILGLQFISGLSAYSKDIRNPFTQAKSSIAFLKSKQLDQKMIVTNGCDGTALSAYLERPIYFISYNEKGSYCRWGNSKLVSEHSPESVFMSFERLLQKQSKNLIFISYRPFSELHQRNWTPIHSNMQYRLLEQFENSIIGKGNYYIYELALSH